MSILRVERKHRYTHVPNAALEDTRLSFKARGILTYLLSKPDHWRTNSAHLVESGPDKRDSVRSGMRELEQYGYLTWRKYQDEKGQWQREATVRDVPSEQLTPAQPGPDNPAPVTGVDEVSPGPGYPASGEAGLVVTTEQQLLTKPKLVTTSLRSVGEAPAVPSPKKPRRQPAPEESFQGDTKHLFETEEAATPQPPVAKKTVARRRGPVGPDSVSGLVNYFAIALAAAGINPAAQGVGDGNVPMMSAMTRLKRKTTPAVIRGMVDQYVADPKYRRDDQPEWKGFIFHSAELQRVSTREEDRPMTREDWLGTSSG